MRISCNKIDNEYLYPSSTVGMIPPGRRYILYHNLQGPVMTQVDPRFKVDRVTVVFD